MRNLILKMSVSVDGFVGGPDGEIGWMFGSLDAGATAWLVDTLWQAGVHVMGSRTFHDMAAYWPSSTEPFAAPVNEIPKVVFSRKAVLGPPGPESTTTALRDSRARRAGGPASPPAPSPAEASWTDARVASGELAEEIARLKREPGKDILAHGGARFAQSLAKTGLIDEYRLLIHPVALGRGLPLFSAVPGPIHLRLVSTKAFDGGAVAHVYRAA